MSDDKSQSNEINIPGDGHTFIGSANAVNISGPANVYLAGEVAKSEVVPFGKITISLEDSKLLEELKKDVQFGFWEKADDSHTVVRFATSWATRMEDVQKLLSLL